jgi:hypothetical protein
VRFETVFYRNAHNNDTMFNGLLQRKITVFREATLFAKALMSARIRQRCCYLMPAFYSEKNTNRTQCFLLTTNMSDKNRMPPISNLENCQSGGELTSYYAKFGFCGKICAFCVSAWQLCGCFFCLFGKYHQNCQSCNWLIVNYFYSCSEEVGTCSEEVGTCSG